MATTHAHATCRDCGSTDVEWRQNKAGKWYLAELQRGIRGSVYSDGPHYRACTARGPKADQLAAIAAHNAQVEAERAAQRATIDGLIANGGSIDELMAAGASFNDIVAAGVSVEQLTEYWAQHA